MVMGLYFYSISSIHTVGDRARALFLAREGIEATINMRDAGYSYLVDGDHGLAITDGHWAFLGTSDITDKYTRIISISPLGLSTKLVTSTVSWIQAGTESVTSFTFSTQLALWTTLTWFDSSASDFGLGTYQQTLASTTNN